MSNQPTTEERTMSTKTAAVTIVREKDDYNRSVTRAYVNGACVAACVTIPKATAHLLPGKYVVTAFTGYAAKANPTGTFFDSRPEAMEHLNWLAEQAV